jgi:hypothetical protein
MIMSEAPATPPATPPASPSEPPATPPAAPPAPFYDGFKNPDVKTWVASKGYADPEAVAQSAWHFEKLHGVPPDQLLKLPKVGADAAEWGPVYDKLGRPKDAASYTIPVPDGDDGAFAKTASAWFHETGLTQSQAEKLAAKWNEHIGGLTKTQTETQTAKHTEEVGRLKAEWGPQFDSNSILADRAGAEFGMTTEQLQALKQAMGPAAAMKFLHAIGSKVGSDAAIIGGDGKTPGFGGMTPAQAQAKIAELQKDKGFAARFNHSDVSSRDRAEAREEMSRLHKIAYP